MALTDIDTRNAKCPQTKNHQNLRCRQTLSKAEGINTALLLLTCLTSWINDTVNNENKTISEKEYATALPDFISKKYPKKTHNDKEKYSFSINLM